MTSNKTCNQRTSIWGASTSGLFDLDLLCEYFAETVWMIGYCPPGGYSCHALCRPNGSMIWPLSRVISLAFPGAPRLLFLLDISGAALLTLWLSLLFTRSLVALSPTLRAHRHLPQVAPVVELLIALGIPSSSTCPGVVAAVDAHLIGLKGSGVASSLQFGSVGIGQPQA